MSHEFICRALFAAAVALSLNSYADSDGGGHKCRSLISGYRNMLAAQSQVNFADKDTTGDVVVASADAAASLTNISTALSDQRCPTPANLSVPETIVTVDLGTANQRSSMDKCIHRYLAVRFAQASLNSIHGDGDDDDDPAPPSNGDRGIAIASIQAFIDEMNLDLAVLNYNCP